MTKKQQKDFANSIVSQVRDLMDIGSYEAYIPLWADNILDSITTGLYEVLPDAINYSLDQYETKLTNEIKGLKQEIKNLNKKLVLYEKIDNLYKETN